MKEFVVIHGPNLNLLGKREQAIYGQDTLQSIDKKLEDCFKNHRLVCLQSNIEGELITYLQNHGESCDGIVLNPAAYSHTSVGILDAITAIRCPVVEVHLSNIYAREPFRQVSLTAQGCIGQITGFGFYSYVLGIHALENWHKKTP